MPGVPSPGISTKAQDTTEDYLRPPVCARLCVLIPSLFLGSTLNCRATALPR